MITLCGELMCCTRRMMFGCFRAVRPDTRFVGMMHTHLKVRVYTNTLPGEKNVVIPFVLGAALTNGVANLV